MVASSKDSHNVTRTDSWLKKRKSTILNIKKDFSIESKENILLKGITSMNNELRQYSLWGTIGESLNLYIENFFPIVLISLLCQIVIVSTPGAGGLIIGIIHAHLPFVRSVWVDWAVLLFSGFFVRFFLSGWIIYWVSNKFPASSTDGRDSHRTPIFPLILPVIGLSLFISFVVPFGFSFFLIPGFMIMAGLSVAIQVLVIEKQSMIESLKRSWHLTQGKKGLILAILLITNIIIYCIRWLLFRAIILLKLGYVIIYLSYAIYILTNPVMSCILVVIYYNLRIEKEGYHIEHLVQQFPRVEPGESSSDL
jgi:hypothetical protein